LLFLEGAAAHQCIDRVSRRHRQMCIRESEGTGQMTAADLFEGQAARTPEAPAVAFGDATLTYRQLDDAQAGQRIFRSQCTLRHAAQPGRNLVGPSLFGVVGRQSGTTPGYHYSPGMSNAHLTWDTATLDRYLENPRGVVPGTLMAYVGLKDAKQRADLIAYLRTLSPNPAPLPGGGKAPEPTKAAETAPAPGTAAPAGNHSALGSASAPNSAPASSPNVIGPPGQAYNANAQTPNVGTQVGGTGAEPHPGPNAPANSANQP